MIDIDGKTYRLEEAYAIPEGETNINWDGSTWGKEARYINVATDKIDVKRAFVLVEVEND